MRALGLASRENLVEQIVEYLRESLPRQTRAYGDPEVYAIARYAIGRAAAYRIERRIDVYRWVNLMFSHGFKFDTDPKLPWVRAVLDDPSVHPDGIMPWLTARAIRDLKKTD